MAFNIKMALAIIVIGIIVTAAISFYIWNAISPLIGSVTYTPKGTISADVSLIHSQLLQYNGSQGVAGYALLKYIAFNATGVNVSTYLYAEKPITKIYFVNTTVGAVNYCVRCFAPETLADQVYSDLSAMGEIINSSTFNYVNIDNLGSVPNDSMIVIASGLMPTGLMPYPSYGGPGFVQNISILTLMKRGDTIIYVGKNFSTTIGIGGNIFLTPQDTLNALSNASITTATGQNANRSYIESTDNQTTFLFFGGTVGENATAVASGNGTIVALGNYPEAGWTNESSLAKSISRVINSRFWMNAIGYGSINESVTNDTGYIPALTTQQAIGAGSVPNNVYGVALVRFYNNGNYKNVTVPFRPYMNTRGKLYMPATFGEMQNLPVTVAINSTNNQQTSYYIDIKNAEGQNYGALNLGFYSQSFDIIHYYSFSIPSGYYIASLRDIYNNTYAEALFSVAQVNITPISTNFKNGTFLFNLRSNGQEISNASYSVKMNGAYEQSGTIQNGILTYKLPMGTITGYGSKTFVFSMFGTTYSYNVNYQGSGQSIPPIYIEFLIAAIFVVILNMVLKAPNVDNYYIDIPKFPPVKKTKVKTDANAIINVFDSVNYSYHWKFMPLTAEEVKTGISANIRYGNMPIAVTLQNTSALLNKLVTNGMLSVISGYYAPVKWIESSKHDIEYLTIFRKLRDYCVTNAMLFTDLDASQNSDMIITKMGVQAHIVIYSSISGMKDIALNNSHKIYLVFLNEGLKLDFMNSLYNSYGEEAQLMKIGIEYSYIVLIDTDNLDQMVI